MAETPQAEHQLRLRHWLGYALLCAIWSTTWMAIRVLVTQVPPFRAAALRFGIAAIVLLAVAVVRRSRGPRGASEWRVVAVLSVTMMTIPFGVVFWAEQYITSSMTAVLSASTPLIVALLTPVMLHHKVPRRALLALVIGLAGIVALFWNGIGLAGRVVPGGIAILVGCVTTAWSAHYAKRNARELDPVVNTGLQLASGTALLGLLSVFTERGMRSHWSQPAIVALFFLAIVGSAVGFGIYYWLLKRMKPYQLSTTALIVPIGAMVEGYLILHEKISLGMIGASLLVLVAVAVVLRAQK